MMVLSSSESQGAGIPQVSDCVIMGRSSGGTRPEVVFTPNSDHFAGSGRGLAETGASRPISGEKLSESV